MITTSVAERDSFARVFRVLSSGMTALALVALVRPAFVKWTLSAPMQLLMDAYNATIQVLLGWTEPYLGAAVAWFNGLVGWHVTLSPSWRDAFVITTLVLTALISGERLSTQRWLLLTCLGAFGALVSAMLLGVILGGTTYGLMYVVVWFLPFAMAMLITSGENNLYIEMSWALLWIGLACGVVAYLKGVDVLVTPRVDNAALAVTVFALTFAMLGVLALVFAASAWWFGDPTVTRHQLTTASTILGAFAGAALFFATDRGIKLLMG